MLIYSSTAVWSTILQFSTQAPENSGNVTAALSYKKEEKSEKLSSTFRLLALNLRVVMYMFRACRSLPRRGSQGA